MSLVPFIDILMITFVHLPYNKLQVNAKLLFLGGKKIFFLFGSLKRAGC